MKIDIQSAAVAAIACAVSSIAAAAPTLVVQDGVLIGARNVLVTGHEYDVDLIDGTCSSAYGQCALYDFAFNYENAVAASWALLESVFVDSSAGNFDSEPFRIRGCVHEPLNFGYACMAFTPAYFERDGVITSAVAINQPAPSQFTDWVVSGQSGVDADLAPYVTSTWAVWRPSAATTPVPEPNSWMLLLSGVGLVALNRRFGQARLRVV